MILDNIASIAAITGCLAGFFAIITGWGALDVVALALIVFAVAATIFDLARGRFP